MQGDVIGERIEILAFKEGKSFGRRVKFGHRPYKNRFRLEIWEAGMKLKVAPGPFPALLYYSPRENLNYENV